LNEAPQRSSAVGDNLIPKVMFPIIRRVMPELIANKLVSVQPLTQPTGLIYYILYTYSNTKGEITKGNEFSMNPMQTSPAYATWYSSDKIGPFVATQAAAGSEADIVITAGASVVDFLGTNPNEFTIKRVDLFVDGRGVANILSTAFDGSMVGAGANVAYNATTGALTIAEALVPAEKKVTAYIVYDQEGSKLIPEMEFSIESTTVQTDSRKIKIRWTKESEQDMQAYHKIDTESELVKIASMQMNYEIDREIIQFISDRVSSDLRFSHDWTADTAVSGNNTTGNFLDRHHALAQKLHLVSAEIAQYNRISPATWAVVSPRVAALLQMVSDPMKMNPVASSNSFYHAGKIGGKLDIYVDPNRVGAGANDILLGYKSENSTYGAGVVYSPYANWMSNTISNPENFDSVRGFFSRYALTMVRRGEWNYGSLTLENLTL
jgi:hypothetical protein